MKTFKQIYKIHIAYTIAFVIFITFCSCSFSNKTCKKLLNESFNKNYDIIVVPGVPLEDGKWSLTMKARVYWSKFLYDKGIAKNVMYSGSAVYSPYIEAEIMAMYAEAIGIPKEHIFVETKAEHSTENIFYSYKKAKKLNFSTIALASDPFQTKLLKKFINERLSPEVGLIPIVYDSLKTLEKLMTNPTIDIKKAYVENFVALPDRESFWQRMRGTRGLNIDYSIY
jgi:uncharacterized SAM-binding protein YcdF (DUF218 family)